MNMNDTEDTYDEDVNDQPIDYSKKYVERNAAPPQNRLADESQTNRRRVPKKEFDERDSKVDLFSDYAETDLDQPTDYSLRYGAEGDTDEEEKQSAEYFPGSEQEDTIKTYCTEGTPYETPFNFSTATSMSDLRDMKESDLLKKMPKKTIEMTSKSPVSFIEETGTIDCDEQDNLITKELEEENPKDAAVLNPGQVTPEKIVSYYEEEGTLQGFSRANSLNSLNSAVTSQNDITGIMSKVDSPSVNKEELENEDHNALALSNNQIELSSENDNSSESKSNPRVPEDKEGKMVTFGGQDYYVEETPLMFSRSSSLGSLSGFEQHSIHDDRSSVISDFSRRTSGIVSPSELPDSPTQTVLSSPRNHKIHNTEFPSKIQEEAVRPSVRHISFVKPQIARNSVFEDEIATFKEESTPIEFSGATSLSSLTIDDEVKISDDSKTYCRSENVSDTDDKDLHRLEADMRNVTISDFESKVKEEQVSDGDEDEDMLAACINMGMQTNRYRQSLKSLNSQKSTQSESPSVLESYQRNSIPSRLESHAASVETPINTPKTNRTAIENVASDTVHVYCTEDTPADISPMGSLSNLSALSMPSLQEDVEKSEQDKSSEIDCHGNDLFDESANLSGEDEKILNECIQSGMPKARQMSPPVTSSISFVKKSERLSHKFNICDTPSSSPVDTSHGNKNPILNSKLQSGSLRYSEEFSDDSPNHSEDEAILTECIQSAMLKAKCSSSPVTRPSPLSQIENSKMMNMRAPSTSSAYFQPRCMEQRKNVTKKVLHFEDNTELSEEEEDIMLAQCIRSGMPKAINSMPTTMSSIHSQTSSVPPKKFESCSRTTRNYSAPSPSYYVNKSYTPRNATPHSPSMYKSVNINTADPRYARNAPNNFNCFPGGATSSGAAHTSGQTLRSCDHGVRERINNSPCCARRSPLRYAESENGNTSINNLCVSVRSRVVKCAPILNRTENNDCRCRNTTKSTAVPSRHSSASSLNEEASLISTEEWGLLELCITSGMPRNKYRIKATRPSEGAIPNGHDDCEPVPDDNYSVHSYNYICKT